LVPKLNRLHSEKSDAGLTIIGVTGETDKDRIDKYVKANGVQYLIAMGGASDYRSKFVPHGWLVSAEGEIVWEGHPGGLSYALLEEQLKSARMIPPFEVPLGVKKVQKYVDAQQIGKAITTLEKYIERPKDKGTAKDAKRAVKRMKKFASAQIRLAKTYAVQGHYSEAMKILGRIATAYKKTDVGDKAKGLIKTWNKDKTIKAEIKYGNLLDQAESMFLGSDKEQAQAVNTARSIAKSKKLAGTKAQKRAKRLLKEWD
jgi:tetratricopeptide (TPR) repeat protein